MLLGGLWHGAGWTFVVWGGLHGIYLVVNHGWRNLKQVFGIRRTGSAIAADAVSIADIFFCSTGLGLLQSRFS
jgi:alginate O-acetyltransferase complex protein AlgI